ncbi:pentatricopeptide repeat-containing protein At2g37320-like [Chenopodium quinoa]|uniref:pentatricopeptide repeat-containing protein At2g37320-like n=1 Tax=Chenopodium quinoa TaxID=63459 RepID=UPI000B76D650|nr:pentatricopeptide repeat-containing protein At2g37320-like [Chenopodium quinoa]XP_021730347.1 pentatricopeptide repeat-containing protein At2g37320-like [Chenopodium quinoa]XP_021730348.1 pentatricopeptide repeat-containing protein At2g37320-like [Chenopodium quinoa]XP_021730349.1 pentatricopeptide repeat-containing protein At2g37320-like [Chenopodium quinoa]
MDILNLSGCYWKCKRTFFKSVVYFTILQTLSQFRSFSIHRLKQSSDIKSLNKALRIIDLVSPKSTYVSNNQHCHLQLIQDLLQTHSKNLSEVKASNEFANPCFGNQNPPDQMLPSFSFKDDVISGVFKLHREGFRIDVTLLPHALSICGFRGNLHCGTQLQCLAIRNGLIVNVYVGSSLISMYSKCGDLCSASMAFEEMPVRNVVSWTAFISGFAQKYQVDVCLELYSQMRHSSLEPNDYTLTSLLSACVGNGSLGQGRSAHCLAILSGFDSYLHVANALVSMYCKCGDVEDAFSVFESIHDKDIVSWNSMISGYALHGLAWKAIDLFEEMKRQKMKPDSITFLGVLSSCRHFGLVKQGHMYFDSMVEYGVEPDLGHYSCIVDLLGRAGLIDEGRNLILDMPIKPNAIIWGSLLASCRLHDNVWIGIEAAENRLALEPSCAATHVQLAKLYARVGMWDQVAKVWKMMKDTDLQLNPGYSWIEIGNEVVSFKADDTTNSRMDEVFCMLEGLKCQLKSDHVPESHEEFDIYSCTNIS